MIRSNNPEVNSSNLSIRSSTRERSKRKDDEKDKAPNLEKTVAAAALVEGDGRAISSGRRQGQSIS